MDGYRGMAAHCACAGYRGEAPIVAWRARGGSARMGESVTTRRSLASHTVVVALALGVAQVAAYLVSVIAARALGPDRFGILAALLGILLIGSVLSMGIQAVAARRMVHLDRDCAPRSAAALMRVGLVGGLSVTLATVAITPLLMWFLDINDPWSLLAIALTFIPITWAGAIYGVAQGRESYLRLAMAYALVGLGRGIGGVAGALITGTVLGTVLGLLGGTILGTALARIAISPLVHHPAARLPHVLGESAHATHALLALFVLTNVDVLLARALLSADEAGLYGVGAIIAKVAFWLPQFVSVVAFPRFADSRRLQATVVTLGAVAGLGLLVTAATAALPRLVVSFVGGEQYAALAPAAWLFAAAGAIFALGQALLLTRVAIDDRRAVVVVWFAAATLVTLATWVMPHSVTGLISSAIAAGLVLASVGVVVTIREWRRG